jgi:hypothetical protein
MRRIRLLIAAVLIVCSFLGTASEAMVFPEADWQQVRPESQGVDSAKLKEAVSYLKDSSGSDGVNELVIIRNGYMIWRGPDIDKMHGVWSLTKSFTSTVLGLLIDDGKATLDTLAKDHVPSMAATYPDITLRHFTTMTSGYYAVGDKTTGSYKHGPSRTTARVEIRLLGLGYEPVCQRPDAHRRRTDRDIIQAENRRSDRNGPLEVGLGRFRASQWARHKRRLGQQQQAHVHLGARTGPIRSPVSQSR